MIVKLNLANFFKRVRVNKKIFVRKTQERNSLFVGRKLSVFLNQLKLCRARINEVVF
jgi:hypothetical protein